jgi:hypothetical protein
VLASLKAKPGLRRLLGAWALSCVGTGAGYVALLLLTYRHLHSSWAVSAVLLGQFVPAIAFGSWFGALADRAPKRLLVVTGGVLQAIAYAGMTISHAAAWIVSLALIAGIGNALQRPALRAALPNLAGEFAQAAAALFDSARWVGVTVGPLIVAALLLFTGPGVALAATGAAFAVAAVVVATVRMDAVATRGDEIAAEPIAHGIRAGLRVAFGSPGVGWLIACSAGGVIAGGLLNVSEPIYATSVIHAGGTGYAVLQACYGVGMVAATALVAKRGAAPLRVLVGRYLAATVLGALGMLGTAIVGSVALAGWTFAATGYANGLLVVSETQIIFMLVSNRVQGRLFGAKDMIEGAFFLTGLVAAAPLIATTGIRITLGAAAGISAICATAAAVGLASLWRLPRIDADEADALAAAVQDSDRPAVEVLLSPTAPPATPPQ